MIIAEQLIQRRDLVAARVETNALERKRAEKRKDWVAFREHQLQDYYHGGEVAGLNFAIGLSSGATPPPDGPLLPNGMIQLW